jgi:hypothetical protein
LTRHHKFEIDSTSGIGCLCICLRPSS